MKMILLILMVLAATGCALKVAGEAGGYGFTLTILDLKGEQPVPESNP